MNILIVDDEPLGRSVLRAFLADDSDVDRVEECVDGPEAARLLARELFDVLFLDIRMPGLDGFGVLDAVPVEERPLVIFVTAFEEHALKAFSFGAVDYLLKPFDDRRFGETLERVKERHRERLLSRKGRELIDILNSGATPQQKKGRRLPVTTASGVVRIDTGAVLTIEAQDKHVVIRRQGDRDLRVRHSISSIEAELDPERFLRVHRSCIVALDRVTALEKTESGIPLVVLEDGARVVVSRSRLPIVRSRLSRSRPTP